MGSINKNFWNKYFKNYDVLMKVFPYQTMIEEITNLMEERKVLDIGSGTGNLVLNMNNKKIEAFGIDISNIGISISKKKGLNNKVFKINIISDDLPFNSNYFTGITMINIFRFIEPNKRDVVMKKILNVVKNNSRLVMVDMKKTYSPFIIYKTHMRESILKKGFIKTFVEILTLFPATVKMFYYNIIIKNHHERTKEYFLSESEYMMFFKKYNYNIIKIKDTFAQQAKIIIADRII